MSPFSFHKQERLKSRKVISHLFKEGKSIKCYPLLLIWSEIDPPKSEFPVQFAKSVPKRSFAKAVHRNVLRRQISEAFRINKHLLYDTLSDQAPQYALMVIYIAKEALPFHHIEKATRKWINILIKNINQ